MTPTELTELDRMLAEFMGFSVRTEVEDDRFGDFPPDAAEYYNNGQRDVCMTCDWHPTTDIAQAFMVAEKADTYFELKKLVGGLWEATVGNRGDIGDTPALAICLAAKSWLESMETK